MDCNTLSPIRRELRFKICASIFLMWFLIFSALVFIFLVVVGSLYFVVFFQHEEDKNMAYFPKVVVVIGLTLSCINVMSLSSDVMNRDTDSGVDFGVILQILLMFTAVYVIVLVPFTTFYYEAAEDEDEDPVKSGIKWSIASFVVFGLIIAIFYLSIGYVELPVKKATAPRVSAGSTSPGIGSISSIIWEIRASPTVYIIGITSLLGWVFLGMFGGVGLAALPFDMIRGYNHRPRPILLDVYSRLTGIIHRRAKDLLDQGREIQGLPNGRKRRKRYNKFRAESYLLEEDYKRLEVAYRERGGNPLKYFIQLILGIVFSIVSLLWVLHIILYMLPKVPFSSFLNGYLASMDNFFTLFGTITYGLFSFYLLLCVIKGIIKMGVRLLFIPVHPIKFGETVMSSLLFNTAVISITSIAVTQFCSMAFDEYIRQTAIQMLFSVQISNLMFFHYVFDFFIYVMVAFLGLTLIYLTIKPRDKTDNDDLDFDR